MRFRRVINRTPVYAFGLALIPITVSADGLKSCGDITDSGPYELKRNITYTGSGTCLRVLADDVIIDFSGFRITGMGGFDGGTAIGGDAARHVELKNGTISQFYRGISLGSTNQVVIRNMSFTDMYGSAAILGDEARVAVSSFTNNAEEPTWALEVGSGSIVENCIFFQNNIAASIGPASLVSNNIVRDSNEDGMNVGANSTVIGNTVTGTYDEGLRVGAYSNVLNNNAHDNDGTGDLLVTCPSNVVGNSVGILAPSNPGDCNFDDNLIITSN